MFLGTYKHKFSGKNRIILPKKLRKQVKGKEIILTKGLDGCIFGFGRKEWEREAKLQLEVPLTEEKGRDLRRYFFAQAEVCELDHQGRFVIDPSLIDFAQIKSEILLIGAGDHFEIWNHQIWDKIMNK